MDKTFETLGQFAAMILPLFNIPLIMKVLKRRSSADISISWIVGVWACFVLMFPSGIKSSDTVYRTFSIINIMTLTVVMLVVLKYRKGPLT